MLRISTNSNKYEQGIHRTINIDNRIVLPIVAIIAIYIIAEYKLTPYLILFSAVLAMFLAVITSSKPKSAKKTVIETNNAPVEPVEEVKQKPERELTEEQRQQIEHLEKQRAGVERKIQELMQ